MLVVRRSGVDESDVALREGLNNPDAGQFVSSLGEGASPVPSLWPSLLDQDGRCSPHRKWRA